MVRYTGSLHQLCDAGHRKKGNWDKILSYIHSNSTSVGSKKKDGSPGTTYESKPNQSLINEALDKQGPNADETPLRICVMRAPSRIVSALIKIAPKSARIPDRYGRIPLHWACRRPTGGVGRNDSVVSPGMDAENVIRILIELYPGGLLCRDNDGRTPLHWIFLFHASSRAHSTIDLLLTPLPLSDFQNVLFQRIDELRKQFEAKTQLNNDDPPLESGSGAEVTIGMHFQQTGKREKEPFPVPKPNGKDTPFNAAIVPDNEGCLPLHYAVGEGVSREVIKSLVRVYPTSINKGDRYSRTALFWYLSSGLPSISIEDEDDKVKASDKVDSNDHSSFSHNNTSTASTFDIVPPPPQRSTNVISLLLNPEVARMHESPQEGGQLPLHVACRSLALSILLKPQPKDEEKKSIEGLINSGLGFRGGDKEGNIKVRAIRLLIDANRDAVMTGDAKGRTPLHVFLGAGFEYNQIMHMLYKKNLSELVSPSSNYTYRTMTPVFFREFLKIIRPFHPPAELVRMLIFIPEEKKTTKRTRKIRKSIKSPKSKIDALMNDTEMYHASSSSDDDTVLSSDEDGAKKSPKSKLKSKLSKSDDIEEDFVNTEELQKFSSHIEDNIGQLPLHYACESACPPEILSLLIELNPSSLITTDDIKGRTPLHAALGSIVSAPLQSTDTIKALLDGVIGGGVLDGRCVLKMKDLSYQYPLHLSAENGASSIVLDLVLRENSEVVSSKNEDGNIPLHLLFDPNYFVKVEQYRAEEAASKVENVHDDNPYELVTEINPPTTKKLNVGDENEHYINAEIKEQCEKISLLISPLIQSDTPSLTFCSSTYALLPLHVVVSYDALSASDLLALLNKCPSVISKKLTYNEYTALDIHEKRFDLLDDEASKNDWFEKKIMIFAFHPDILPYRRDEKLLKKVSQMIRLEAENIIKTQISLIDTTQGCGIEMSSWEISQHNQSSKRGKDSTCHDNIVTSLSDVALRLWIFFVTFVNLDDPDDHYAAEVEYILDEMPHECVLILTRMTVPRTNESGEIEDKPIMSCANPFCAEILHSCFYFIGKYKLPVGVVNKDEISAPKIFLNQKQCGQSLVMKADEYLFSTCDGQFCTTIRPVCIKFFKNESQFDKEIHNRNDLQSLTVAVNGCCERTMSNGSQHHFLPILNAYDSIRVDNKGDRRFKFDLNDDRFSLEEILSAISLSNYPYAIVTPLADRDLWDILVHEGIDMQTVQRIAKEVGSTLQAMHEKNIIHCDIDVRNIYRLSCNRKNISSVRHGDPDCHCWVLGDFGSSCQTPLFGGKKNSQYLGELGNFSTGTLPPEMFTKLDPTELNLYKEYWTSFDIDPVLGKIVEPKVMRNGEVYVLKAFHSHASNISDEQTKPALPFDCLPSSPNHDIWSFGVLLFMLCSDGRSLFPLDARSGHLREPESYEILTNWTKKTAETMIYDHIEDPLAQDILLKILVPLEERQSLNMESILQHPYFHHDQTSITTTETQKIHDRQSALTTAMKEEKESNFKRGEQLKFLNARSVDIYRTSIPTQMKIINSATELSKKVYEASPSAPNIPLFFIVLPYKLVPNKAGKLTPSTKRDVELAEKIGKQLLNLSKTSSFVVAVKKVLEDNAGSWEDWADRIKAEPSRVSFEIVRALGCSDDFMELSNAFVAMATLSIDQFISDPLSIAKKLVQENVKAVLKTFHDTGELYLYMVDEYNNIPIVNPNDDIYPHCITTNISQVLRLALPFMHMGILYVRAVQQSVAGLVKLIFEGAYPHIPSSWTAASKGLFHELNSEHLVAEVIVLKEAIESLESFETIRKRKSKKNKSDQEICMLESLFDSFDPNRFYSGLKRIVNGKCVMWTTQEGVEKIVKEGDAISVEKEYLNLEKCKKEIEEKDAMIKALQLALRDRK